MELALFLPFLLFLFIGAFDWGFYAWALISTENAARVAALYTSGSPATAADSVGACIYAIAELADAPNVASNPTISGSTLNQRNSGGSSGGGSGGLGGVPTGGGGGFQTSGVTTGSGGSGGSGSVSTCTGPPVTVTAIAMTGPNGGSTSEVAVTYQTPVLIPIPGLLTNQVNITRVVRMRVKS